MHRVQINHVIIPTTIMSTTNSNWALSRAQGLQPAEAILLQVWLTVW